MEQGYWNTSSSRLWTRVRDLFHEELVEKYNSMRQKGLSYESLMKCFYDEQIAKIPQKYYLLDYDVKYAPFADSYIGMAHGDTYEHVKRWLKQRLTFCDTLFDYAPSYNNDVLTIRANTTELMNLQIETYTPVYLHLSWYNGQMDKKKVDGKIATSFSGYAMAETDQEVLIYGGSNVKAIRGIQSTNPNRMLIGYATRLTELDASNCPLLDDINANKANLSPHIYLNKLNLSNCPKLGGSLRLNNAQLIQDIDITGTAIDGLQLPPTVRNLEVMKLSEDIVDLTLRDAALLREITLPANIQTLSLINVPNLAKITSTATSFNNLNKVIMESPTINPISNITSKAPNLQYIRLTNLDIACSSAQIQSLLRVKGVDQFGNEIPLSQAVSGKITLSQCSEQLEAELREAFPLVEFTITGYVKTYRVTFVDGDGNVIYETHALENGEAVYLGDTPTKTSTAQYDFEWKGWNRQLKPITSDVTITATFNDILRYYTIRFINSDTLEVLSSQYLGYGEMPVKPSLDGTDFNAWNPAVIEKVTKDMDYYTQYIPYPDDISMFTFYEVEYNDVDGYACSLNTNITDISYLILPFQYNDLPVFMYSHDSSSFTASSVEEVYMPETIKVLGRDAFRNFTNLKSIDLSEITRFSYYYNYINFVTDVSNILYNCDSLTSISLPKLESLASPASGAYGLCGGCQNLKYVYLGSSEYPITKFTGYYNGSTTHRHFYGSNNLVFINLITENGLESDVKFTYMPDTIKEKIICSKAPVELYSDDTFNYRIIDDEVIITAYKGTATEVEIPNTVKDIPITKIGYGVFENDTSITKVTLPSIVTSLGDYCFYGCSNLTEIDLSNITSLGDYCFSSCIALTSVDIPLVTTIPNYCFQSCTNLTEIDLSNITSLGNYCLSSCTALTSIDIPLVTTIPNYCFYSCSNLAEIDLSNITSLGAYCFSRCTALTSIDIPLVTTIGTYCFERCTTLTSIDIPLVTTIPTNCFRDCYNLTEVNAPNVTSLGGYCFANSGLTSADFPLVTTVSYNCFEECGELTSVNLPLATTLSTECFNYCDTLTSISLPSAITLGDYCFGRCASLVSVDIPNVTTVNQYCFSRCGALTTLQLPKVTTIQGYIFYYCQNGTITLTLGGVGNPITNTSGFSTVLASSEVENLVIYVSDASNPPTLTGSPWGANSATITYEQA